jgi:hypothetical protein
MDQDLNERPTTTTETRTRGQPLFGLDRREPRMRVDLTFNIPTMISILVLITTTSATGVGMYYSLDKRQMATDYAVTNLTSRVEKAEAALSGIKADQTTTNSSLRAEVRADLAEIKGQLNQLMFAPSAQRQQLHQWSR